MRYDHDSTPPTLKRAPKFVVGRYHCWLMGLHLVHQRRQGSQQR
jgi:hypothetical protein